MPYVIEPMQMADVPEVSMVERECFTSPWPASAYRRELRNPQANRYVVARWVHPSARRRPSPAWPPPGTALRDWLSRVAPGAFPPIDPKISPYPIAGFAGLWLMVEEAHVTTIGVAPAHRGRHVGELLFLTMLDIAMEVGAAWLTLEVRVSNTVAQNLYQKYGLHVSGRRRQYYSDNGEDAYLMESEPLRSPEVREGLRRLRAQAHERLARQDAADMASPAPLPAPGARPAPERS
jgi:[ribosomal protein S18]-alanine N-acetyltransferase